MAAGLRYKIRVGTRFVTRTEFDAWAKEQAGRRDGP